MELINTLFTDKTSKIYYMTSYYKPQPNMIISKEIFFFYQVAVSL